MRSANIIRGIQSFPLRHFLAHVIFKCELHLASAKELQRGFMPFAAPSTCPGRASLTGQEREPQ